MGYDGIEWRGGAQGHVKSTFSPAERTHLQQQMRDAQLTSLAVTAYTAFSSQDAAVRAANVDEIKRQLDLAADLHASYVRAFLGELAPGQTLESTTPHVIESLQQALPHAHQVGVGIAIEHHDDFIRTASLMPILTAIQDPYLGAVWDIANAWSAGETPEAGAQNVRDRISYVQIKDGRGQHDSWKLTDVGAGDVPLQQAIALLSEQNYDGALSVEWEYTWHPELAPPERALPEALAKIRGWVSEIYKQPVGTSA